MASSREEIVLHERPQGPQRCPYCHDALAEVGVGQEVPCASCGTLHHEVCLAELGGCTVLGCQGGKPRPQGSVDEVRGRIRERLTRFMENIKRPPSARDLEQIAREGWECPDCSHRFWSLECARCGEVLGRRCRRPGHPCRGCGQKHSSPAVEPAPRAPVPTEGTGNRALPLVVMAFGAVAFCVVFVYLVLYAFREGWL